MAACILAASALWGCAALFEPMGKGLGSGLADGFLADADTLGQSLAGGAAQSLRDTLASPLTERKLKGVMDSLGAGLTANALAARDSLLGPELLRYVEALREAALGKGLRNDADSLLAVVLGERTRQRLDAMLADALGDSTRGRLRLIRDDLLGARTYAAADSLVAHVMGTAAAQYESRIRPMLRGEGDFLTRNAKRLLASAAAAAALLMGLGAWLFNRGRKYRRLLELLTLQIHRTPDRAAHEDLIRRIQYEAQKDRLEPGLRKILEDQGILRGDGRGAGSGPSASGPSASPPGWVAPAAAKGN